MRPLPSIGGIDTETHLIERADQNFEFPLPPPRRKDPVGIEGNLNAPAGPAQLLDPGESQLGEGGLAAAAEAETGKPPLQKKLLDKPQPLPAQRFAQLGIAQEVALPVLVVPAVGAGPAAQVTDQGGVELNVGGLANLTIEHRFQPGQIGRQEFPAQEADPAALGRAVGQQILERPTLPNQPIEPEQLFAPHFQGGGQIPAGPGGPEQQFGHQIVQPPPLLSGGRQGLQVLGQSRRKTKKFHRITKFGVTTEPG